MKCFTVYVNHMRTVHRGLTVVRTGYKEEVGIGVNGKISRIANYELHLFPDPEFIIFHPNQCLGSLLDFIQNSGLVIDEADIFQYQKGNRLFDSVIYQEENPKDDRALILWIAGSGTTYEPNKYKVEGGKYITYRDTTIYEYWQLLISIERGAVITGENEYCTQSISWDGKKLTHSNSYK